MEGHEVALIFSISIAQSRNLATQRNNHATLQRNATITQPFNLATQQSRNLARNATITQPCNATIK
jgi:hypothetical protein